MHSFVTFLGYLDPATGSIIIQAVVGAVAGIAIFGRRLIGNVVSKIRSTFAKKEKEGDRDKSE